MNPRDISRWRRIGQETAFVVLGQAMSLAGAAVGLRLLTRKVEPAVWGQVALCNTAVVLLGQVCFGPLGAWMQRNFAPFRERGDLGGYFDILGWINRRCLVLILIGASILSALWFKEVAWALPAALACGVAYVQGLDNQMTAIQTAGRHRAVAALHQTGTTWLKPLAAYCVVLLAGATTTNVLGGYLWGLALVFGSQLFFLNRLFPGAGIKFTGWNSRGRPSGEQLRQILLFGVPMAIWGLTAWLQMFADRWVVRYYLGESFVGILAVSVTLASVPIIAASSAISTLLYPIVIERAGDATEAGRMRRAMKVFRMQLLAFGAICGLWLVVAFVLREAIVGLVLGSRYAEAVRYFPPLTIGWILMNLGTQVQQLGLIFNATRRFLIPTVCCSVLAVALLIAGTIRWGLMGTAGAFVLASALTALVKGWTAWRLIRVRLVPGPDDRGSCS